MEWMQMRASPAASSLRRHASALTHPAFFDDPGRDALGDLSMDLHGGFTPSPLLDRVRLIRRLVTTFHTHTTGYLPICIQCGEEECGRAPVADPIVL